MTTGKRAHDEPFVVFGPDEARKARRAAGLPERPVKPDVPDDAGRVRRLWAYLTQGADDLRKLWSSASTR